MFILFMAALILTPLESLWEAVGNDVPIEEYAYLIGSADGVTRKLFVSHVKEGKFSSVLDIGCGIGTDYFNLLQEGLEVDYLGIELGSTLVNHCNERGFNCILARAESLPLEANRFELVWIRHLFEHVNDYRPILNEALRVASKEVMIAFFIPPSTEEKQIVLQVDNHPVPITSWNRHSFEEYLNNHSKISHYTWEKVDETEEVLYIHMVV